MRERGGKHLSFQEWLNLWPMDYQAAINETVEIFAYELWEKRGGGESTSKQIESDKAIARSKVRKMFNPKKMLPPNFTG